MLFRFNALSGGIPLGGSHQLMEYCEKRMGFDCGAIQRDNKVLAPPLIEGPVDALLATHGHLDHVGMLAYWAKMHPESITFGTEMTRRFAWMLGKDSIKITQEKIAAGEKNIQQYFNESDLKTALKRYRCYKQVLNSKWFSPWPDWQMAFKRAGHINGAAKVQIVAPSGLRIEHSGDLCFIDQPTVKGADTSLDFRPDVLITEATYGDRDLPNRATEEQRLIDRVIDILMRGSRVLIPAFSTSGPNVGIIIERGLARAVESGIKLPTVNVYIDGMLRTAAWLINRTTPWDEGDDPSAFPPNLIPMPDKRDGWLCRRKLLAEPAVIVSSHGMVEGGKIMTWLPFILPDPTAAVLIPGYQAEGTGGRKLLELEKGHNFVIPGFAGRPAQTVPIYCDVERFYLSSHASGREIAEQIVRQNPKVVIVVHATEEGFQGLKRKLLSLGFKGRIIPAYNGQEIAIDDRNLLGSRI